MLDPEQVVEANAIEGDDPHGPRWWRAWTGVGSIGYGEPWRAMRPHKVLHERFNPDNPYLYRWLLFRMPFGLFSVYLHRIVRSDDDPDPHDHPWLFWGGLILEGGYEERVWTGWKGWSFKERRPGSFYLHGPRHAHRVELNREPVAGDSRFSLNGHREIESWTLFVAGPKVREWGFIDRMTGCWTQWRAYVQGERC